MSETAPEDVESPRPPRRVEQLLTEGGSLKAPDTPEKKNYVHASARSPLFDNIKFVFMYGIVQWHSGRCGQNIRCMPGAEAILGEELGILNCFPKCLGSACLTGFMLIAGVVYAGRTINLRKPSTLLHIVGIALAVQYGLAPPIDWALASRIPSNGHVWFMYALATARAFVGGAQLAGLSARAICAFALAVNLFAALGWHYVLELVGYQRQYDGLTWSSSEWFDVVGSRWFTFILYFAVGCLLPAEKLVQWNATTRGSPLLWRLALFTLGVNFFYNLWRLDLRASNLFVSAPPQQWLERMPVHIEFTIISTLSPILILLVLPPHRVGRITDWGENTLFCYLVHPFGLKLVYKPLLPVLLFAANGVAFAPLRNLLLFLILSVLPLVVQIGLCHLSIVLKATYQKWKNRKEPRPSKEAAADVAVSAK